MSYEKRKNCIIFRDFRNRLIIWHKRDYKNELKQHHDHEEYNDIEGISETLASPDKINKSRHERWNLRKQKRIIYYRDKGEILLKWHQVVVQVPKNWDSDEIEDNKKKAILITTQYLNTININEENIWP